MVCVFNIGALVTNTQIAQVNFHEGKELQTYHTTLHLTFVGVITEKIIYYGSLINNSVSQVFYQVMVQINAWTVAGRVNVLY